jgi:molybdate transport system substrate-binding protein
LRVPGRDRLVAERLVDGRAELALHQISEIIAVPGITLVGPIPAAIQNYTVYAGGISTTARDVPAAQACLAMLASPRARELLEQMGMEAP